MVCWDWGRVGEMCTLRCIKFRYLPVNTSEWRLRSAGGCTGLIRGEFDYGDVDSGSWHGIQAHGSWLPVVPWAVPQPHLAGLLVQGSCLPRQTRCPDSAAACGGRRAAVKDASRPAMRLHVCVPGPASLFPDLLWGPSTEAFLSCPCQDPRGRAVGPWKTLPLLSLRTQCFSFLFLLKFAMLLVCLQCCVNFQCTA